MCIPPNAPICNCFSFYVSFFTFLFFSSFLLSSSHSLSYSQHKIVKSQEHKSQQVTRASHQNGITNVRRNTRTNSRTSQEIVDHPLLLRPPRTWPLGRCRCASRSCGFCHPPPPRHGGCAWCLLRPRVPAPCAPHSRGGHTGGGCAARRLATCLLPPVLVPPGHAHVGEATLPASWCCTLEIDPGDQREDE